MLTITQSTRQENGTDPTSILVAAYHQHSRVLFTMAYSMFRDYELSDELVGSFWAQVFISSKKKQKIAGADNVAAYLKHAFKMHLLEAKKKREGQRTLYISDFFDIPDTDTPLQAMVERDKVAQLHQMVHAIPAKVSRQCMIIRFLQDRSALEVAEILDLSINTVKTHLKIGLQHLRKMVREKDLKFDSRNSKHEAGNRLQVAAAVREFILQHADAIKEAIENYTHENAKEFLEQYVKGRGLYPVTSQWRYIWKSLQNDYHKIMKNV